MKRKREATIIGVLLLMLVITIGLLVYQNQTSKVKLDEQAKVYEGKIIRPDEWDENQIAVPGYETIQMLENTNILPIVLVNPAGNPCYFKFSLYLDEKNEAIYQSEFVEPGHMLQSVPLTESIAPGTHQLVIDIETISLHDGESRMNSSQVVTEIVTYEK